MIPKNKKRITITIQKKLNDYLEKKAKENKLTISKLITITLNDHFYEYEKDYPNEINMEIENDIQNI